MSKISPDQRFVRRKGIIEAKINDESVMMCMEQSSYFGLDEIGTRVWSILAEPCSLREICDILTREYDVDHPAAMVEIEVLLKDLVDNHLVLPDGIEG